MVKADLIPKEASLVLQEFIQSLDLLQRTLCSILQLLSCRNVNRDAKEVGSSGERCGRSRSLDGKPADLSIGKNDTVLRLQDFALLNGRRERELQTSHIIRMDNGEEPL